MSEYTHKPEENKYFITGSGSYISKVGEFYRAYRKDGTELQGVTLPINIMLLQLKGLNPGPVRIYPSDEDIFVEPSLKRLRKK